jgi:SAM-dependent methyltransferase
MLTQDISFKEGYYSNPRWYELYTNGRRSYYSIQDQFEDYRLYAKKASEWYGFDARILDTGCGTGRVLIPLAENGFQAYGIDSSVAMIDYLRQKTTQIHKLSVANACDYFIPEEFELILWTFDLINHLLSRESLKAALECARTYLTANGRLIIDTPQCSSLYLAGLNCFSGPVLDSKFQDSQGNTVVVSQSRHYDELEQLLTLKKHFEWGQQDTLHPITLQLKLYLPEQILDWLFLTGYKVEEIYGDFQGNPLKPTSRKMILVCQKR